MAASTLSPEQLSAIQQAQNLLESAGLSSSTFLPTLDVDSSRFSSSQNASAGTAYPTSKKCLSLSIQGSRYQPPPARSFTEIEKSAGYDRVNRKSRPSLFVEHPLGSIVEYPQTGSTFGQEVLHRFAVHPSQFYHPKQNMQYSHGLTHGGRKNVTCGQFLTDSLGTAVKCDYLYSKCKGLKVCSHRAGVRSLQGVTKVLEATYSSEQAVIEKTLAFYCSILEKGCTFDDDSELELDYGVFPGHNSVEDSDDSDGESSTPRLRDPRKPIRSPETGKCNGKMVLTFDRHNHARIECEFRQFNKNNHLILRNLNEFHIGYLTALLTDNKANVREFEEAAYSHGYGPLVPCDFTASFSEQKQLCPHWHRDESGKLDRGLLVPLASPCPTSFKIYTPQDLLACPFVVIICSNPHSHPNPCPVQTPPALLDELKALLYQLDWKLADATPRKLCLDSGFIHALRHTLGWDQQRDPNLSDLHPSFANLDHVRRQINVMRIKYFPEGTGFTGAQLLIEKEKSLDSSQRYVRCAELYPLDDSKIFQLIICMSDEMARRLMSARNVSIDTAFRRIHGWQEFEIETWDDRGMKSFVGVRAFINSQSAQAHLILFRRIFELATDITGNTVRFRHIHNSGYEVWLADAHRGQALGLGEYCRSLCCGYDSGSCTYTGVPLAQLDAYEHLQRILRLCQTHFKRKIHDLRTQVKPEIISDMLSLSSSRPHPDFDNAVSRIKKGGKKAAAWMNDKLTNKFVIPAIYQPASCIPLHVWQGSPSTTNGNEQAHRNINRDGVNLTVLGGIMRGREYDFRAVQSLEVYDRHGIFYRDQNATVQRRMDTSVTRQSNALHRRLRSQSASPRKKAKKAKTSENNLEASPSRSNVQVGENAPIALAQQSSSTVAESSLKVSHSETLYTSSGQVDLGGHYDFADTGDFRNLDTNVLNHTPGIEWFHSQPPSHVASELSQSDMSSGNQIGRQDILSNPLPNTNADIQSEVYGIPFGPLPVQQFPDYDYSRLNLDHNPWFPHSCPSFTFTENKYPFEPRS